MTDPAKRSNQHDRRGSIKRDASGRWFYVFDVDTGTGKRKQVRRRGFASPADAWVAMQQAKTATADRPHP